MDDDDTEAELSFGSLGHALREDRRHPRLPVALRVRIDGGSGELTAMTRTVSRDGFDLRLPKAPSLGERLVVTLALPSGDRVRTRAECRSRGAGGLSGFVLELSAGQRATWDAFLDEEESTGSLWRLVARWARGRGDEKSGVRTVTAKGPFGGLLERRAGKRLAEAGDDVVLRFHMVGENGEAYRLCFEKHASSPAKECDLARTLEGFSDLAEHAITRVLDEVVHVRLFEDSEPLAVRVCELRRGGYAWVQGESEGTSGARAPVGLVSLGAGELLLIEVAGEPVFPFLDDNALERIACDTFRHDLQKPMFTPSGKQRAAPGIPAKDADGVGGVLLAQASAQLVQRRSYDEREIDLFPDVWARAVDDSGHEVLGPTMRDGERTLLLALVGSGAPRMVPLESATDVSLLSRRRPGS